MVTSFSLANSGKAETLKSRSAAPGAYHLRVEAKEAMGKAKGQFIAPFDRVVCRTLWRRCNNLCDDEGSRRAAAQGIKVPVAPAGWRRVRRFGGEPDRWIREKGS
ncbi:hypothetical protein GCM10009099_32110 [Caenispirillum bisanense]